MANFYRKSYQSGRSMIEMLGVLAIIGMLSLGSISAYSRAMGKHQMNKLVEEYNFLIARLLEYENFFTPLSSTDETHVIEDTISDMDFLPQTWKKDGSTLYDSVGNKTVVFVRNHHIVFDVYLGRLGDVKASQTFSYELCQNLLVSLLQPLHDVVFRVGVYRAQTNSSYFFGDRYCNRENNNKKCLVNATITDFRNVCNTCQLNVDSCILLMEFL